MLQPCERLHRTRNDTVASLDLTLDAGYRGGGSRQPFFAHNATWREDYRPMRPILLAGVAFPLTTPRLTTQSPNTLAVKYVRDSD